MLIIAGDIRMQPGTRQQFFDAVAPMVTETLLEPGCRAYAFTPDPDDDDLIRLWELWDDEDALAGRDLNKYTVAEVSPLG